MPLIPSTVSVNLQGLALQLQVWRERERVTVSGQGEPRELFSVRQHPVTGQTSTLTVRRFLDTGEAGKLMLQSTGRKQI